MCVCESTYSDVLMSHFNRPSAIVWSATLFCMDVPILSLPGIVITKPSSSKVQQYSQRLPGVANLCRCGKNY